MIGLIISVIIFNLIALKVNKKLTLSQIVQIWTFTIAFQNLFDLIVEFKFHGYWYFSKDVDWIGLIPRTILIPPVNIILLNLYPFGKSAVERMIIFALFVAATLLYELTTLLPQPWGYFNYGWWKIEYSLIVNPIILYCLLGFYKWITLLERKSNA
jgi:hypothetical protein